MAKQSISTIKNWFRTGLKPTQAQFWDWLDSYFHLDSTIPTANVAGLDGIIAGLPTSDDLAALRGAAPIVIACTGAATQAIAAGKILEIVVIDAASNGSVGAGTSTGGTQIISDAVTAGVPTAFPVYYYFKTAGTLYLTGTFTAKLYIR